MKTFLKELSHEYNLDKHEISLVICHVIGINTAGLMVFDKTLKKEQKHTILDYLNQREKGKPLAYIIGYKEFWDLKLKVNQHTLIPRPETEQIVELVLESTQNNFAGNILDLGTGTGAIALSLASELPHAHVSAVDFSNKCILIALQNKDIHALSNVEIFQSDWFQQIDGKYDFIVSNPPYIAENDKHLNELIYEPQSALTSKKNGLADIEHIIITARKFLKNKGTLILEHGYNQHLEIQELLMENRYLNVKTHKDLAQIPRITSASFQNLAIDS